MLRGGGFSPLPSGRCRLSQISRQTSDLVLESKFTSGRSGSGAAGDLCRKQQIACSAALRIYSHMCMRWRATTNIHEWIHKARCSAVNSASIRAAPQGGIRGLASGESPQGWSGDLTAGQAKPEARRQGYGSNRACAIRPPPRPRFVVAPAGANTPARALRIALPLHKKISLHPVVSPVRI